MCSASFLSLEYFCSNIFLQILPIFVFSYDFYCLFVNGVNFFFSKLIMFIASSPKGSQNIFMQSSPLNTYAYFLYIRMFILQTSNTRRECISLLLLQMIFQNYQYIHLFFQSTNEDLHK